jgi:hypothetical protein
VRVEVIEGLVETRKCVACAHKTKAGFPVRVKAPVQYGEGVRARAIYLQKYQLLPFGRTSEAMRELFGCGISPAALMTVGQRCSYKLINTELTIKGELKRADVIGADETGVRLGGRRESSDDGGAESHRFYVCGVTQNGIFFGGLFALWLSPEDSPSNIEWGQELMMLL